MCFIEEVEEVGVIATIKKIFYYYTKKEKNEFVNLNLSIDNLVVKTVC